jgi:hypothetical protein
VRRHLQEVRASGKPAPDKPKTLTIRTATWLITSHPDNLDESSTLRLKKLLSRSPELDTVAAYVRSFATMMTERRGSDLEKRLAIAEATGMKPLQSLARGHRSIRVDKQRIGPARLARRHSGHGELSAALSQLQAFRASSGRFRNCAAFG